ncbi:MAG: hypothetical protein IPI07_08570 [Flavobacteriales bacterium]|nr:hypothetical protein [Flavobacteriales bacterium]
MDRRYSDSAVSIAQVHVDDAHVVHGGRHAAHRYGVRTGAYRAIALR